MLGGNSMFGPDLSDVRTQQTPRAGALGAAAYATGSDTHVGAGQYGAGAAGGKALLAHELTHVVEQGGVRPADIQAAVGHYGE